LSQKFGGEPEPKTEKGESCTQFQFQIWEDRSHWLWQSLFT